MLSTTLKSKIQELWYSFRSGGIANPLTAIEQITYLVFLKRLEDLDNQRAQEAKENNLGYDSIYSGAQGHSFRWSYIYNLSPEERLDHVRGPVFDWMRNLPDAGDRMRDAVFIIPSPNLLNHAVDIINQLFIDSHSQDTIGNIYEMLLAEIAESGKNGQFKTPRHIIRAMCDLIDPQFGETVCDPTCGTAGFLVNALQHILKSHTERGFLKFEADGTAFNVTGSLLGQRRELELRHNHFYGFDFDRTMVRLGWMNMKLHGMENPRIEYADTLGSRFYELVRNRSVGDYDIILANPPFAGNIDKTDIGDGFQDLGTTKTELLFINLIIDLLKIGGRAAIIVPESVLFGSTSAHKTLRRKLVTDNQLDAVISLPGGVFHPYTGVKTSILVFKKGGQTNEVWFYEVTADGYTLNAKRDSSPKNNDLWDMVLKYALRFNKNAPIYVDDVTWYRWKELTPEQRSLSFARPSVVEQTFEYVPEPQLGSQSHLFASPESNEMSMFVALDLEPLEDPRDWSVSLEGLLASDYRLDADFYKPQVANTYTYDPPQQILNELLEMESHLKKGLQHLLRMIGGVE